MQEEENKLNGEATTVGVPVSPTPNTAVAPTTGVDASYSGNINDVIQAEQPNPETVADPYNKAVDTLRNINQNALTNIERNHIDTIGTERGGQRSLLVGGNDNYLMSRYSTPAVEQLVDGFKTLAVQRAFGQALDNEYNRLREEAKNAIKNRQKRDKARAEAKQQAEQSEVPKTVNASGIAMNKAKVEKVGENQVAYDSEWANKKLKEKSENEGGVKPTHKTSSVIANSLTGTAQKK